MIKRILVGLGGTPFTDVAIRQAVVLAQHHGASVVGVTVVDPKRLSQVGPVPLGGAAYAEKIRERRLAVTREALEATIGALEAACRDAAVDLRLERESANPFERLIALSRYSDLTVFGLRSLFDCDFASECGLASEPRESVIRLVSSGVRPIIAVSPQYREIRSALMAYSGSMGSAKAMRRFVQMRPWSDLRMGIVHFEAQPGQGGAMIADAVSYCRAHGIEPEAAVVAGDARIDLLRYAQEKGYDLIVLANGMGSLMRRRLMGDTVLDLIQRADRPLFLTQ